MKKRTLIIATLCVMLLAACGPKPGEVVEEYYKAVQAKDYNTALNYSNVTDDVRDVVIQLLDSSEVVVHNYKVIGSTIDPGDTTATVKLHLVTSNAYNPNKIADDIDVPCIKSGSNWVVELQPSNN